MLGLRDVAKLSQVWDAKPDDPEQPINWVELKTSQEIQSDNDMLKFERKLLKFWAQSFLLGVPKIIVGFRSRDGILQRLEELEMHRIPGGVKKGRNTWDGNLCINFTARFLDCKLLSVFLFPVRMASTWAISAKTKQSSSKRSPPTVSGESGAARSP